MDVLIVTLL